MGRLERQAGSRRDREGQWAGSGGLASGVWGLGLSEEQVRLQGVGQPKGSVEGLMASGGKVKSTGISGRLGASGINVG